MRVITPAAVLKTAIPALHQSTVQDLACEVLYADKHIRGVRSPASPASLRGTEIHSVAANYVGWCLANQVSADWAAFDRFAREAGPEAAAIVNGIRDTYSVDYEHIIGVEQAFILDEHFQPMEPGAVPAYAGTKDIELRLNIEEAAIEDWKSHPSPWEPPDVQSDLYSIDTFQRFPDVEKVTFTYRFVRYGKCARSYTYDRSELPEMMERAQAHRTHQWAVHEKVDLGVDLQAMPGSHCVYCPRLSNQSCPLGEFNPHENVAPADRLRFNIWAAQQMAFNRTILKATAIAHDSNVRILDGNGKPYEYGCWQTESTRFPLLAVAEALTAWKASTGEDLAATLFVGSTELKPKLKAKKRAGLQEALAPKLVQITKAKWAVKSPDGTIGEEEE